MPQIRGFCAAAVAAALVVMVCSSSVFADHLDRHVTRRLVRHLEERSDVLQDRVDDWIDARLDERTRMAEDLNHHLDHFENTLITLRSSVLSHDEPWDVRDDARAVRDAAAELHHALDRAVYLPHDVWRDWEALRVQVNELARLWHLDPVD
jgi:hemerythrin-like domain-containing protein